MNNVVYGLSSKRVLLDYYLRFYKMIEVKVDESTRTTGQCTRIFMTTFHKNDYSGHDIAHINRVERLALYIADLRATC
jgi:predicted DNA-binding protein YlxM (UPF0122 family)